MDWLSDHDITRGWKSLVFPMLSLEIRNSLLFVTPAESKNLLSALSRTQNSNEIRSNLHRLVIGNETTVLMPINISNVHWILLCAKKNQIKNGWDFSLYDSSGQSMAETVKLVQQAMLGFGILNNFTEEVRKNCSLKKEELKLKQSNGVDCGVFVFEWIRHLAGVTTNVSTSQDGILSTRQQLESLRPTISTQSIPTTTNEIQRPVFLSFAGSDGGDIFAASIRDDLRTKGIDCVFWDKDIRVGNQIQQSLKYQLDKCICFVCIITPAYLKSSWPLWELTYLNLQRKNGGIPVRIIPVCLKMDPDDIMTPFEQNNVSLLDNHSKQNVRNGNI